MASNMLLESLVAASQSAIAKEVAARHSEFKSFAAKGEEDWFSELCFCLLTANSSAQMGIKVQGALGFDCFYNLQEKTLSFRLKELGYRFYNKRAEYIAEARKHFGIKKKLGEIALADWQGLQGSFGLNAGNVAIDRAKRDYLFENVKGLGMKEASHFLRNTGHDNVAILDRHILRAMREGGLIPSMPKHLTKKNYLEFESALDSFAEKAGMNHAVLDLYLWYLRTGKVLK